MLYSMCTLLGAVTWQPKCWRAALSHASHFCSLNRASCLHVVRPIPALPPEACIVNTPLHVEAWANLLSGYPNQVWVQLLLDGLRSGVWIGFKPSSSCRSAVANMPLALARPVVQAYLDAEQAAGNLAGPFSTAELPGVIFNRFGVIPKANKLGEWRPIC